jgi:anti-anti-sigma factor
MASQARSGGSRGKLNLASTFLSSFPPSVTPTQERHLSSLPRVREEDALTIRLEPDGDSVVIRGEGRLDITSARNLEDALCQALTSGRHRAVTLHLGQVEFIDSTGLRVLLRALELASDSGTQLGIARELSPPVERILTVSGVADRLPFVD